MLLRPSRVRDGASITAEALGPGLVGSCLFHVSKDLPEKRDGPLYGPYLVKRTLRKLTLFTGTENSSDTSGNR
ncbi:hypothetical protein TNCV_3708131 [Trichonephila clavipes]|nr:hypothetical protein TNCV_3708131 [Trichonephila clavipes]